MPAKLDAKIESSKPRRQSSRKEPATSTLCEPDGFVKTQFGKRR